MIKRALTAAVAVLSFVGVSIAENKEERALTGDFRAIEVSKGANVSLIQCDKTAMEVVTDGCPTSDVETVVKDGVLSVKMKKRTPGSAVQVFVYFKDLDRISVRRGASISTDCLFAHKGKLTLEVGAQSEASLDLDVTELDVDANTCVIKLEGKAERQNVVVAGTVGISTYNAEELETKHVKIKAIDTDAVVNFSESLTAEAVSCTIKYVGDSSKVKKTTKGGGSVEEF
ncbi:MAG: DUF2807 domain-containing protein [Bacteroidales bacterium]|nr:DUF2807 domain-containing protein [Bacteroidales bacterium]